MAKQIKKKEKSRVKEYAIIVLLLLLVVSVGYATLLTQLNINGTTKVTKNTWNVYISEVANIKSNGKATVGLDPSVVSGDTSTTALTYEVDLVKPGDYYQFDFEVTNGGTIDIELKELPVLTGLSTDQDVYVNHTITNPDGTAVTVEDSAILAGETKTYTIKVEYDTNIENSQLPQDDQVLDLRVQLDYIQK